MKEIRHMVLMCLVLVLLAACAILPRSYVEPSDGAISKIVFKNTTDVYAYIHIYENAKRCSRRWMAPAVVNGSSNLIKVPADNELAFTFGHNQILGTHSRCVATVSFLPRSGEMYVATLSPNTPEKDCSIDIKRVSNPSPISFKRRKWKDGSTEDSDFCEML